VLALNSIISRRKTEKDGFCHHSGLGLAKQLAKNAEGEQRRGYGRADDTDARLFNFPLRNIFAGGKPGFPHGEPYGSYHLQSAYLIFTAVSFRYRMGFYNVAA